MIMRFIFLILCLLTAKTLAEPLQILTSIKPLALIAKDIAGDHAKVEYLVPNEGSIHHYSMRVSDRLKVDNADIVLLVGAGLEPFTTKLRGVNASIISMDGLAGIETLALDEHDADHDHGAHAVDPHLWLSPHNAKLLARSLADAMAAINTVYADQYAIRLARVTQAIDTQIQAFNRADYHYFTYHNAFAYLFNALQLTNQASITSSNEVGVGMRSLYKLKQQLASDSKACVLAPNSALQKTRKQLGQDVRIVAVDMLGDHAEYSSYHDYLTAMLNHIAVCQ